MSGSSMGMIDQSQSVNEHWLQTQKEGETHAVAMTGRHILGNRVDMLLRICAMFDKAHVS
jgi:hypothetical protein